MTIVYLFAGLILTLASISAWAWGPWAFIAVICASILGLWLACAAWRIAG